MSDVTPTPFECPVFAYGAYYRVPRLSSIADGTGPDITIAANDLSWLYHCCERGGPSGSPVERMDCDRQDP
jgi:hypothetical protein